MIEGDPLGLQEGALQGREARRTLDGDLAVTIDDPPPRHVGAEWERAQCSTHPTGGARCSQEGCQGSVAHDRSLGNLPDEREDPVREGDGLAHWKGALVGWKLLSAAGVFRPTSNPAPKRPTGLPLVQRVVHLVVTLPLISGLTF